LVEIIYERGEFTQFSTSLVAWALLWYGLGLVFHSVVEVVSRAFYSLHDTKTPVAVGIVAMSLNVIFSLIFVRVFGILGLLQLGGLALANSLATGIEMILLYVIMHRRLGGLHGRSISVILAQSGSATLIMYFALQGWILMSSQMPVWLMVVAGIIIGGIVYGIILYLVRNREIRNLTMRVRQFRL
jgi:putative peptidoglycan lipid II flippase